MKKYILLPLVLFCLSKGFAEPSQTSDSLNILLHQAQGEVRVHLLHQLAELHQQDSFALALRYHEEALSYSQYLGDQLLIANAYFALGELWREKADTEGKRNAIPPYIQASQLYSKLQLRQQQAHCEEYVGSIYMTFWDHEHALPYFFKALGLYQMEGDTLSQARVSQLMGELYYAQGDFDAAFKSTEEAQELLQGHTDPIKQISLYHNLGKIANAQLSHRDALNYFSLASRTEQAYWGKASENSLVLLGFVYTELAKMDSAFQFFSSALQRSKAEKNSTALADAYAGLAAYYWETQRDSRLTYTYLDSSNVLASQHYLYERLLNNYQLYADIAIHGKQYKKGIQYLDRYYTLLDSVNEKNRKRELSKMQMLYEVRERESQLELFKEKDENNRLAIEHERFRKIIASSFAAVIFLISLFLFFLYRQKQRINVYLEDEVRDRTEQLHKANEELVSLNQELDTFAYRTAHDIRGPVARLLGLCHLQLQEEADSQVPKTPYLDMIYAEAQNMDMMLHRFLEVNNIKHQKTIIQSIAIKSEIEEIVENLASDIEATSQVDIQIVISPDMQILTDTRLLETVMKNLIENAILYRGEEPKIMIGITRQSQKAILYVCDNGQGVSPSIESRIFEMFFRGTPSSKGLGLGLYAAQLAAQKLGGSLHYNPSNRFYTEFFVELPQDISPT